LVQAVALLNQKSDNMFDRHLPQRITQAAKIGSGPLVDAWYGKFGDDLEAGDGLNPFEIPTDNGE